MNSHKAHLAALNISIELTMLKEKRPKHQRVIQILEKVTKDEVSLYEASLQISKLCDNYRGCQVMGKVRAYISHVGRLSVIHPEGWSCYEWVPLHELPYKLKW